MKYKLNDINKKMETIIKLKEGYNSLDKVLEYVSTKSNYECEKIFNSWRTISFSKEYCILIKKNSIDGAIINFVDENEIRIATEVPSKYFYGWTVGRGIMPPLVRLLLSKKRKTTLEEVTGYFKDIMN